MTRAQIRCDRALALSCKVGVRPNEQPGAGPRLESDYSGEGTRRWSNDRSDAKADEAQPPRAEERQRAPLDGPRWTSKRKRRPGPRDRKRSRIPSQDDGGNTGRHNRRPAFIAPQGVQAPSTPAGAAPPQDLPVGGNVPPEGRKGGLSKAGPAGVLAPPAR